MGYLTKEYIWRRSFCKHAFLHRKGFALHFALFIVKKRRKRLLRDNVFFFLIFHFMHWLESVCHTLVIEVWISLYLFFFPHTVDVTESKRLRKPSKRLLEWSEEYEQIFTSKKKTKKTPESSKTVRVKPQQSVFVVGSCPCFKLRLPKACVPHHALARHSHQLLQMCILIRDYFKLLSILSIS